MSTSPTTRPTPPDPAPPPAAATATAGPSPRPGLRDAPPYRSPQLAVPVRLATNESPYPPSPALLADLAEAVRSLPLHRYPDREASALRSALGERTGHPSAGVWAANGSNEVLQQLLAAYGGPGRRALLFEPTYLLHRRLAETAHTGVVAIRTEPPFALGEPEIRAARDAAPDLVFVCSPNNPTGTPQPLGTVASLARALPSALVVVDQAYLEFGGEDALPLVGLLPNVVVVRTFSKAFGFAGGRLGYCLARPELIDDLRRVALPYHLSALAQAAGLVALRHADEAAGRVAAIRAERDRLLRALATLPGASPYPSAANFVLFRPVRPAAEVWRGLLDRGVLVRDLSDAVDGCLRVTAGAPDEDDRFLAALEEVLAR